MPLFVETGQAVVQVVWLRVVERVVTDIKKCCSAIQPFAESCEQVLIAIAIKNPFKQGDGLDNHGGCFLQNRGRFLGGAILNIKILSKQAVPFVKQGHFIDYFIMKF
ncbi:hypothetical protein JYT88_00520 [Rhodospirillaceae bacterium AH-315-P19]|nr:hypothetical protein [Rhodospirillaceae bacterium AH-315-P19]